MANSLNIIRPAELADIYSVSQVTIWRWEKAGKIPPRRKFHERCVGWLESDLKKYLESRPYADPEASDPELQTA